MAPRRPKAPPAPRAEPGERPGDAELWQRIKESARPLDDRARAFHGRAAPSSRTELAVPSPPAKAQGLAKTRPAPSQLVPAAPAGAVKAAGPAAIEPRLARRLSRGSVQVEARLDLHGMRQHQAQQALFDFLLFSQKRGRRLVLVITGKGRSGTEDEAGFMPARDAGILRRALPRWLALPRFADLVISCSPAHRRDGGEGAYYMRIRKPRG